MYRPSGRSAAAGACARPYPVLRWLLCVAVCALMVGCGGGGGSSPPPDVAITAQPSDRHVTAGASASFTVGTTGSVTYEWQRLQSSTWVDVAGGTGATLSLGAVNVSDSGAQFRVIVASRSNASDHVTSSIVTLTVDPLVVAAAIATQPVDATVVEGVDASFSVTAAGTAPAYQWARSADGSAWTDIAGATGTTLTLPTTLPDDGTWIRVRVSNSLASVTSNAVRLHVNPTPETPVFTTQPVAATVDAGQTATFTAVASGVPAPTLQWMTSPDGTTWSNITGATGGSYTTPATTLSDSGRWFRAVASNGSVTNSTPVQLTVNPVPAAPTIALQPSDGYFYMANGQTAQALFSVIASGTPTPTYQWQISSDGGASFTNINGATASSYTFTSPVAVDAQLRVVVSNALGSVTSRAATMTVLTSPQATPWARDVAWRPGVDTHHFAVTATGGHLHYTWQTYDGRSSGSADYPGAADAPTFDLPPDAPATTSAVCVQVSNAAGGTSACTFVNSLRWTPVEPQPTAETLLVATWVGADAVVAGGGAGTIVRSADRGATWAPVFIEADNSQHVNGLAARGNVVLAVGRNAFIIRSTDGGQAWSEVYSAPNAVSQNQSFNAVAFTDAGVAIAVGSDTQAVVRTSSDLGLTWQDAQLPANQTPLLALAVNHAGVALGVGSTGAVARSADGGVTWSLAYTGVLDLHAVAFASDSVAVAAGIQGKIWRSTDAGQTWASVADANTATISAIRFSSANVGVATTQGGGMLRTTDGGQSWSAATGDASRAYYSVAVADDGVTAVAVGNNGHIQRSTDAGLTFADALPARAESLWGVAFNGGAVGLATGGSSVLRTNDGGSSWAAVAGSASNMLGLAFANSTTAVVGGVGGLMKRSTDGGATWTSVNTPNTSQLNTIAFTANGVGIAGAEDGVLRTTDFGATWTWTNLTVSSNGGNPVSITGIAFADANTAVTVAASGKVYRSADGGASWSLLDVPRAGGNGGWRGVAAASAAVLVITGDSGSMLRSTDAGLHWTDITQAYGPWVTNAESLSSVAFASATNGVIVGSHGTMLRTADGGLTWQADAPVVDTFLFGVAISQGRAIAVDFNGGIVRSDAL